MLLKWVKYIWVGVQAVFGPVIFFGIRALEHFEMLKRDKRLLEEMEEEKNGA